MRVSKRMILGGVTAILLLLAGCQEEQKAVADLVETEIVEEVEVDQADETVVDEYWSQPIDSEICQTIGECRDLGDEYGGKHFADLTRGLGMSNEIGHLSDAIREDDYDFAAWDDEELIIARYEILEDEFVLTRGEDASILNRIADFVLALYDRNKVNLQTLEFREDIYPHVIVNEGKLGMPTDSIERWYQSAMVTVLIHEYGHLLTKNQEDLVISNSCPADQFYFKPDQECYNADSYMNLYYLAFWKEYEEQWLHDENMTAEERIAFYEKHKDSFVTTYATLNPFEDIAESFTHFMLTPYNDSPQTIPERKVNFFYQFPELVEYRAFVHKKLKDRKDEMWSFY